MKSLGLVYTASGLLTTFTEPGGTQHRFAYDSLGLLTRAEGPDGLVQT